MPDGGALFARTFADAVRPQPDKTVSEWSDEFRRLSKKEASEHGPWRTARVPFARAIMDSLSEHDPVPEVVFMASTQVSKTSIGLNWIGYTIHLNSSPMLWVLPTTLVGDRLSKSRLSPMIAETPVLREKIGPERSRDGSNTATMKDFAGGFLVIGGANSAASLASMPIQKLLLDEIDKYPRDVGKGEEGGGEGDAVDLAEARTTTFWRRKIYKCSSPTIKSLSRITEEYSASSQGQYHVPCPHCGEKQVLRRENLIYPEGKPEDAKFACIHNGCLIEEHHKTAMLAAGEWIHRVPERYNTKRGFHISAWYTPIGLGKSWTQLAARFEEVKKNPVRLKVFINTVDGECYEDPNEKLDWEEIKERAENYPLRTVLPGYVILTAGVDVQKDRLEYTVKAWGRGMRSHLVDAGVLTGDPMRDEVWEELDQYLRTPFRNELHGVDLRIRACAVDSGYLPDRVFAFTRPRKGRNVFAVRGSSQFGRPILTRPSKVDFKRRSGSVEKHGAEQWQVGVDTAKHEHFARLTADRDIVGHEDRAIRFSNELPDEFFRQLCAEVWDPHKKRWVKVYERNEALDTSMYALVAAHHSQLKLHRLRDHDWDALLAQLQPVQRSLLDPPEPPAQPVQTSAPSEPKRDKPAAADGWIESRSDWLDR